MQWIVLYVTGI